jgi:hypothetical protein
VSNTLCCQLIKLSEYGACQPAEPVRADHEKQGCGHRADENYRFPQTVSMSRSWTMVARHARLSGMLRLLMSMGCLMLPSILGVAMLSYAAEPTGHDATVAVSNPFAFCARVGTRDGYRVDFWHRLSAGPR